VDFEMFLDTRILHWQALNQQQKLAKLEAV